MTKSKKRCRCFEYPPGHYNICSECKPKKKSLTGWIHNGDWEFIGKLDTGFNEGTGLYYIPNLIKGKPRFVDGEKACKVCITITEI